MLKRKHAAAMAAWLWLGGTAAAQQEIVETANFEGIPADNTAPPNTTGKAGATQFVQWVNNLYAIYDKASGQQMQPPQSGNSIWKSWTNAGPCATKGSGEPMVEYDKKAGAAGEWVFAQLTLTDPAYYCFAVSTGSDARGPFYYYKFPLTKGSNPSAPRLAVWSDAYYASFNIQPSGASPAPQVAAYDRAHMINGQAAMKAVIREPKPPAKTNFLPADFDGATAPGPGDYYMEVGGASYLTLWQFAVDFADPAKSTFKRKKALGVSPRGPGCTTNPPVWDVPVIPQANTTELLLAYPDQLMYRLAWRNVGGAEHLVANQTVILQSSPVVAGVAWYDIVNPGSSPVVAQQGLVSDSANVNSYWMGSLAQDRDGDIAVGFNASGPSLYPGIDLAGRLVTDPADTMTLLGPLAAGGGAQTNTSLWGSHADMSVDPVDDCTFWFTGEYVKTTLPGFDWNTQIGSFHFTACH